MGRPPTISDLSQVDVPVKTPLFVDRLLQPAYVVSQADILPIEGRHKTPMADMTNAS